MVEETQGPDDLSIFIENEKKRLSNGSTLSSEIEDDVGFWGTLGDMALAVPKGVLSAASGAYNLVDAADNYLFDLIPTADKRFGLMEAPETGLGSAVESVTQFVTGFAIPGAAGVKALKGLTSVKKLNRATRYSQLIHHRAGHKLRSVALARLRGGAKVGTQSLIGEFTVFDGHEARLSNLIMSYPELENPVSEWLAADEEDGELYGRVKNAVEGLGLGALADPVLAGIRKVWKGRKGLADEALEETLEKRSKRAGTESADEAAPKPKEEGVEAAPTQTSEEIAVDLLDPTKPMSTTETFLKGLNTRYAEAERMSAASSKRESKQALAAKAEEARAQGLKDAEFLDEAMGSNLSPLEREVLAASEATAEGVLQSRRHRGVVHWAAGVAKKSFANLEAVGKRATKTGSKRDLAEFLILRRNNKMLGLNIKSAGSEMGRNLQSRKRAPLTFGKEAKTADSAFDKVTTKDLDRDDIVDLILESNGGRDAVEAELKKFLEAAKISPAAALNVARGPRGFGEAAMEWYINALLYAPATHIVNLTSGLAMNLISPIEKAAGYTVDGIVRRDINSFKKAKAEAGRALSLFTDMREAGRAATIAFKTNRSTLDPIGSSAADRATPGGSAFQEAVMGSKAGKALEDSSLVTTAVRWMSHGVTLPTRSLAYGDTLIKSLNYRSSVRAELTKQAIDQGIPSHRIAAYVESNFKRLLEDGTVANSQKFFNEGMDKFAGDSQQMVKADRYAQRQMDRFSPIMERALSNAREATFTTPLGRSADERGYVSYLGNKVSEVKRGITPFGMPALGLVIPFVRTPTNIITYVLDRIPGMSTLSGRGVRQSQTQTMLGKLFQKERLEFLSDNPEIRADAIGRFATGSVFLGVGTMMAIEGTITGGGPKDYNQRRLKEQTGWQPYSIRFGDTMVKYSRLDPIASFLGLAADLVDIANQGDEEQQQDAMDLAAGVALAMSRNLSSKTYLKGVSDLMEAAQSPEGVLPKLIKNTAGGFVPNIGRPLAQQFDNEMKEIRDATDAIYAKIPGLSDQVEARRNLLGEKVVDDGTWAPFDLINPFHATTVRDDKMMTEFDNIGHGFGSPRTLKNGVELTAYTNERNQTAYDRWLELSGETKIQGQTLKQSLKRLMSTKRYQRLPYEALDDLDGSPRARLIQSVLNKYRSRAFAQMLDEFPEVAKRSQISDMIKSRRRVGQDYKDLLALIED
tara:strand:+ start:132 stop:3746 length:3615 start_codon:yes stop_codon:yes gene_type:complete